MVIDWRADLERVVAGSAVVKRDEPLSAHTTFGIGGPADAWLEVADRATLAAVAGFCRQRGLELRVMGRGSNVLVSDQGLRGVVVRLGGELARVELDAEPPWAGAGALLDEIVDAAEERRLAGVDFLAGIPGTLGGAMQSNAGAHGRALHEALEAVLVLDDDLNELELSRERLRNEYRSPIVPEGVIVLGAKLRLEPGMPAPARELRRQRWAKHPKEPSAGSFFRNPRTEPAGRIIERCGLKGTRVGGARVSEQHGNFIVSDGSARFFDVYELAETVKANVEAQTGIELAEEVRVLPEPGDAGRERR